MKRNKCLICGKEPATIHPLYGIMAGKKCLAKMRKISQPKQTAEITTESIRDDRKKYSKDILQSFRDGQLSKEYVEAYPEKVKQMIKEGNVSIEEANKAKNTWSDLEYYHRE
jgi:ketol-acid reductoisomerase